MKKYILAALLTVFPMLVSAADLTIRFTGRFQPGTCAFSVADVDLGTYQATTFTGSTVTGWKQVVVNASNCTSDITHVHMKFTGTADANNNTYFAIQNVSGNVTGVAIELVNGSSQRVTPNVTVFDWPLASFGMSYNLYARFAQTRPSVTAGSIKTPVTIQFTYN